MKCDHCAAHADHHIIMGAMCGKTLALCNICSDKLWEQVKDRVQNGKMPWMTVPIDSMLPFDKRKRGSAHA